MAVSSRAIASTCKKCILLHLTLHLTSTHLIAVLLRHLANSDAAVACTHLHTDLHGTMVRENMASMMAMAGLDAGVTSTLLYMVSA